MMISGVMRLCCAGMLLSGWGLIVATSGSVDGAALVGESGESTEYDSVQEESVEQKITANLMVGDMEKTIAFYRDVLGFEVAMKQPENPPYDWVMITREGGAIMFQTRASMSGELAMFKDMPIGGSLGMFIVVEDVKAINDAVQGEAEIVKELNKTFYGMLEVTIKDPNGYILTFAQPVQ